eukprot:Awhi_evm1s13269
MFHVDLNDYNSFFVENDVTLNRLQMALVSFGEVIRLLYEKKNYICLIFHDVLFQENLRTTPLSVCFPEYSDVSALSEPLSDDSVRLSTLNKEYDDADSRRAKCYIYKKFEDAFKLSEEQGQLFPFQWNDSSDYVKFLYSQIKDI